MNKTWLLSAALILAALICESWAGDPVKWPGDGLPPDLGLIPPAGDCQTCTILNGPLKDPLEDDRIPGAGTYHRLRAATQDQQGAPCMKMLRQEYKAPAALWSKLTLEQRADRIYAHTRRTVGLLKKTRTPLDPLLTPELLACIAYQETRGTFSPHMVNYTFCGPWRVAGQSPAANKKYASSAHGLGQVTFKTFNELRELGRMPITTVPAYAGKSGMDFNHDLHAAMNDDVPLQIEVLARVMDHKLSLASGSLIRSRLKEAVYLYGTSRGSEYVQSVVGDCLPCMKKLQASTGGKGLKPLGCAGL